ncbi:MAG: hypothetical protein KKA55_03975 [Proteobacteria bacterium]|nr:hypothetical protein [Pseudomonadota bacterium]MBU1594672.1 hypothetical protein [Pseudomonadota bacterium]
MLILAGAYEFAQFQAQKPPTPKRLEFMAKAFELLRNDLVFAAPYEREVMSRAGVSPRQGWHGSRRLELHILGPDAAHRIGVILLPPLPAPATDLPLALVRQLADAVRKLRASARLVVAMSPWGYMGEQELLKNGGPLPDVLLGSGPGIGLTGNIAAGGKTLWIRSFSQGKSMSRLDILAWPDHGDPNFKWTEEKNVRMTLVGLTDQYQEDPQVLSLMQSLGTD